MSLDSERDLSREQGSATRARLTRESRAGAAQKPLHGPGQSLDGNTRSEMEHAFGSDFGDVRLHAGPDASTAAGLLGADAYTVGNDVVFGQGRLSPQTPSGKRLLAHELAHVVQQRDGSSTGLTTLPDETRAAPLESDASQAAEHAASGRGAAVHESAPHGMALRQQAGGQTAGKQPEAPRKPRREERLGIGRGGGRVDAELDRDVGWLTVKMKLKFEAVNNPKPWPSPARFEEFKSKFIQTVQARWSFKHFLVPAGPCPGEPQSVAVRLQLIPVTSGEHATVRVGYTDSFIRSSADKGIANLDVLDVNRGFFDTQEPAEHEFGHMLGLGHIHCERNDPECYGTTANEKADIMGLGSFVSPRDYEPFAELMYYFTSCNWNVRQASQIPTSRGPDIGAGIGLLAGGALGAAIGASLGPIGLIGGLVAGAVAGFFLGRFIGTPSVPS